MLGGVITGVGAWLRGCGAGGLLSLGLCLTAPASSAAQDAPRTEYFTGFEVSDNYASAYVGGGYAFGKAGLYDEGWRVRAVGAYGRYHYDGALAVDGVYLPTLFEGQNGFAAALVGYELRPRRSHPQAVMPASRPRISISSRTTRTIRCRAAHSA